ncbi:phosphotransferase family protein [Amycolatopsis cihanbeyliensis]|uniref:Ser/Thr protein kinase RdoA (MazF antagonist) n=1 Tax=Amycolatopsis cihanbeyliensis TaxID=1128664 RepID=A0A542DHD9_AMYCI|nr:phosphotransferase [Amycolatopsis cihanbeyliensis]TQJ02509.1 Ser/Thr protein kinase RdoA (MazF antagonist) [Amycolatopsis cihanbeyliensis]
MTDDVLLAAAQAARLDVNGAELIRDGSNVMYRLRGDIVARIGKPGTQRTADLEVRVSRWLARSGITTVRALDGVQQPVDIEDRPVTWWRLLPKHRAATTAELGAVLRELHTLPVPDDLDLPVFDPFAGLGRRIEHAPGLDGGERSWLAGHLAWLRERYGRLPSAGPPRVIHGDAWQGNVAVPEFGRPVLLDLEHVSLGGADWDLIQIAVDHTDFARLGAADYRSFVAAYGGHDVTVVPGYRTMADIQELRWVCFVLSKAHTSDRAATETRHRIACLRGEVPRPWSWTAF